MADLLGVLDRALGEAGEVLMKHHGALERVEKKGEIDLVTVADRESEACIKAVIHGAFPSHQVLAEESGEDYAGRDAGTRWIVDPLDGTTNFAHSMPIFAVSIGVEQGGAIVAGGVYNPFTRERFIAEQGSGATLNGTPIRVSKTSTLADALLVSGFPYDRRQRLDHYLDVWGAFTHRAHGILRLGSAACDLCFVACGRLDGFWEEKLNPWDTAAGALILTEAGGRLTDFAAEAFSPYGKQILATNALIHEECLDVLKPYFPAKGNVVP